MQMQNIDLKTIEDLQDHITITIIDDRKEARDLLQISLEQEGIYNTLFFDNSEISDEVLKGTNILIVDYDLKSKKNGLDFIEYVKERFGDDIETVLFTGNDDFGTIKEKAIKINVSGVFKKPVQGSYIKLWLKAVTEKIWFKQILDNDPDEIVIRSNTGTILYADKEKERIFGKELLGKKCYNIFENRGLLDQICDECPGEVVLKENRPIRREWDYISRGNKSEHRIHQSEQYLDINVAPLKDKKGNNLGLIEISRDITLQKILNKTIQEMELADSFNKRIEIFLAVFKQLNYERARLYFTKDEFKKFKLVKFDGHKKDLDDIEFSLKDDKPSSLIDDSKKSLLFIRDIKNDDLDYERDKVNEDLYWVGKNKIFEYQKLEKDAWFDIPLFSSGKLIGKVSIDGWKAEKDIPDHYDLSVFTEFGKLAGQVIENAKQKDIIKRKEETNKAILELSKEITNISKRNDLLENTLELIGKTLDVKMCSIFIFNEKNKNLEMKKRWMKRSNNPIDFENYPPDSNCITMTAYLKGEPQIVNDFYEKVNSAKNDKSNDLINLEFVGLYEKILNEPLRNCIFSPLIVGERNIGLLRAMNKNKENYFGEREFDAYDIEAFELLAGQVAVASYNTHQYHILEDEKNLAKKYQQEAEDTLKQKETFLHQLGHELLAPITEIVYENNALLNRYKENSLIDKEIAFSQLDENINSAFNLKNIIDNIEFGYDHKFEKNYYFELVKRPQDILSSVVEMSRVKAYEEKQIEIKTKILNMPPLILDKNRIKQVFINIINNAIQYSNIKSIINIFYNLIEENINDQGYKKWHEIVFSNYGIGINEEDKIVVFDLYERGQNAKNARPSGTGIGLYVAKEIMLAHKGDCIIKRINNPTEIAIYLPFKD